MLYPRMRKLMVSRCKSSPKYNFKEVRIKGDGGGQTGHDPRLNFEINAFERDFNSLYGLHG